MRSLCLHCSNNSRRNDFVLLPHLPFMLKTLYTLIKRRVLFVLVSLSLVSQSSLEKRFCLVRSPWFLLFDMELDAVGTWAGDVEEDGDDISG